MPKFVLLLLACGLGGDDPEATERPSPDPTVPDPTGTESVVTGDTGTPVTTDTVPDTGFTVDGPTATTAATGDTGTVVVGDCDLSNFATRALSVTEITDIPEAEDFEFDATGHLVNVSGALDAILKTTRAGTTTLVAPYESLEIAGTRMLPGGDLVFADEWDGSIVRVDMATGARSVLASGLVSPNRLAVNSDGVVFVGGFGEVVRVFPDGTVERLADVPGEDFDGLALSPDEQTLYLNQDDGGAVAAMVFDAKGAVLSFRVIIDLINGGWGTSLNGASVDSCGRYYVIDVGGRLLRVDPVTETVVEYADLDPMGAGFTTSLRFGSGVGGWETNHIYVIDRNDTVWDLETDIDGAVLPHL